ncbi:GAF domain-containing protein [Kribbella sp. CA-253562]|uniref:GAF domain-containing protein n=1 Tax=Kribbella sp. CA-253562 TaxID=3239942 RepID=UPI003D8BFB8E
MALVSLVHRAPMRSRRDDVPEGLAVDRALELSVCGLGGALIPPPRTLDEAVEGLATTYDDRAARRLRRFAEVSDGAFVWTRESDGVYRLGRLAGPWDYDASPGAAAADLVHVRPCAWARTAFAENDVSAATAYSFSRGGRNFQRIRDPRVEPATLALWLESEG